MTRRVVILNDQRNAALARSYIDRAFQAGGYEVEFRQAKRTSEQNAKMWAMIADVRGQVDWSTLNLSSEDWKILFMHALAGELRMAPSLDGNGMVPLGRSSSALTKGQMSDLIELIYKFGAERGVVWSEPARGAA